MGDLFSQLDPFLQATIRMAVPLVLAGIGTLYTERVGVLNIGVEGSMLVGTFAGVAGAVVSGNIFFAALCAMLAGGLLSLIFAYLAVSRRGDQLVAGFGINLLALGLTLTLMPYLNANMRALDIGGSSGYFLYALKDMPGIFPIALLYHSIPFSLLPFTKL